MGKTVKTKRKKTEAPPLRLDLGCGKKKREGFTGVDRLKLPGVDVVHDLAQKKWPWKDSTVDEVYCSHMIEHLTWPERVFFFNELHRVLKGGGKAQIIVPHWASSRYYGDPTHESAFSEMAWAYLSRKWRDTEAPHCDAEIAPGPRSYSCDFDVSHGYSLHPSLVGRDQKFVEFALQYYKEAAMDMMGNLVAKK